MAAQIAVREEVQDSGIHVLLKDCTAMEAEVAGASVLNGILDLVFGKSEWKT